MRPQNDIARVRLDAVLRRLGVSSAASIAKTLGVSIPTLHRILHERANEVVRLGTTKFARYALRRPLQGVVAPVSVYMIDEFGRVALYGSMDLISPDGAVLNLQNLLGYPTDNEHAAGVWGGLPYPLYDMRPQGYLGRNFARLIASDFDVPPDPEKWSDDHIVNVLSRRGVDTSGNLIVGDIAYKRWLESMASLEPAITEAQLADRYLQLASEAVMYVGSGSSAGGEFPKFTARRALEKSTTPHVIVKFSGAEASLPVTRWADLLVCEHLALEALRTNHLSAAKSRIVQAGGRTFLEVERFDRCGEFGRLPLISLSSLDAAFIGLGSGDWPLLIERLVALSIVPATLLFETQVLWWFGRMIANNDMHLGNLSFQFKPKPAQAPTLYLSPAYDMLPMLYAPLSGGEVPPRQFSPVLPLPHQTEAWQVAHVIATCFWEAASQDERISLPFREICLANLVQLNQLKLLTKQARILGNDE